jgi:hypothetical protein
MIPAMLVLGLVVGRWYGIALAALVWPILLVFTGVTTEPVALAGGTALAAANALIGVLARWGLRSLSTWVRGAARARHGGHHNNP